MSSTLPASQPAEEDAVLKASRKTNRQHTSHLKQVPPTLALREQLLARCRQVVSKLDRSKALTKDQLASVAGQLLKQEGQPEGYLGWVMVMLSSQFYRDQIAEIPTSRRLLLLPRCLKHSEACSDDYDACGINCGKTGACGVADFRTLAAEMGYKVLVTEGSSEVLKFIVDGHVDAILGVACLNVLEKAIDKILLAGIPCMAVPLLSSECCHNNVDEAWVRDMISAGSVATDVDLQSTCSYIHLLRASNRLFQPETFQRLVPRTRSQQTWDSAGSDALQGVDPIAATEALALDFACRGGKYSRPFITLATFDALQGGAATRADGACVIQQYNDCVLRAAISIEMFHKASLVHDDIQDDDQFRYGRPTLHRQFGLSTAINVGDYLIGLGYRLVSRDAAGLGAEAAVDILDQLAASHLRLCEGQGAELLWRDAHDKRLTPADALKVYALKTSPAFEAALLTGVRLAGKFDALIAPLRQFSRNIGVAFQIINDLNDWNGDGHNKLNAGGDVLGGRPTILLALALAGSTLSQQEELLSLVDPGRQETVSTDMVVSNQRRVQRVEQLYRELGVFEQARHLIETHQDRAAEAASSVANESLRRLLLYLLDTVLERNDPPAPVLVNVGVGGLSIASS